MMTQRRAQGSMPAQTKTSEVGPGTSPGAGPQGYTMVTAFVLINLKDKQFRTTSEQLLQFPGITELHLLAGEYDMVAVVRVASNADLSHLITTHIIQAPGVERTKTLFALDTFSRFDLAALFGLK
jgi:DNA-binding Lrp family transcriptional regulator